MRIPFAYQTLSVLLALALLAGCGELPRLSVLRPSGFEIRDTELVRDEIHYQVVMMAAAMLGTPYKWGGENPEEGFDCSGLVQYAYSQAGVELPRTSLQQYRYSRRVRLSRLKPGDLLFFDLNNERVSHVGIYLGNNRFVHAPRTGKDVEITSMNNRFWKQRLVSAGRVVN